MVASSTYQSQRCPFLWRTNDHISSAHSRNGCAESETKSGRVGSRRFTASTFFQFPHDRLRTDAEHARRVMDAAAIQGQIHNFSPYSRLMDFLPVAKLKGAPASGAAIALGAIGCFSMPANGSRLLADGAQDGKLNHLQSYAALHAQHTIVLFATRSIAPDFRL